MKMLLQLYSWVIFLLEFCFLIVRCAILWAKVFYKTLYPDEFEPLDGKVVLITGAGHGIGREMALQFSRLGCILVCWDINEAAAAKTAQEVQEAGGKGYSFCCDVSSQIEVEKAAAKVKATVPQVDIIINNAGIMPCHPFLNHSIQEIDRCIDVNVKGCLWVFREFLPEMIARKQGHLVSMSSIAGAMGCDNVVPYSASKFAVRGMMEALTEEIRRDRRGLDIKCTTVCPFVVDTGLCKRPRVNFPNFLSVTKCQEAADIIVRSIRRGDPIVFIPEHVFYFMILIKILPARVYHLVLDFYNTGVEPHDD